MKIRRRERRRARAVQLAGARKALRQLKIDSEEALLRFCRNKQQSSHDRYRACFVLGSLLGRQAVPFLLELAADEESGVVVGAVDALAMIRTRCATRPLMSILRNSKNASHRQAAIVGLGMLEDTRAERLVSRALLTETCAQTKVYAAGALGGVNQGRRFRGRETVKALMHALPDPSPSVRWEVLNVLGGIRDLKREELDEIRKYLSDEATVPGLLPAEEAGVGFAAQRALNSWTGKHRRPA